MQSNLRKEMMSRQKAMRLLNLRRVCQVAIEVFEVRIGKIIIVALKALMVLQISWLVLWSVLQLMLNRMLQWLVVQQVKGNLYILVSKTINPYLSSETDQLQMHLKHQKERVMLQDHQLVQQFVNFSTRAKRCCQIMILQILRQVLGQMFMQVPQIKKCYQHLIIEQRVFVLQIMRGSKMSYLLIIEY